MSTFTIIKKNSKEITRRAKLLFIDLVLENKAL